MNVINRAQVIEGSGITLLARINTPAGTPAVQSDVSAIAVKIFDMADGSLKGSPTITVAACISNTLIVDARWTEDQIGANVLVALDGSNFPSGGTTYRAEIKITPTTGPIFYVLFNLDCVGVYSQ